MKRGVTLIELLIALVCMIIMIGVVYQLILITERVHLRTGGRAEAEYSIRQALDLMTSELRHAGYRYWDAFDEYEEAKPPNFALNVSRIGTTSDTSTLTFEADFNDSGTIGDRERITYQFERTNRILRRGVNMGTQTDWETMANNVEDVVFTYRDANGNPVNMPTTDTTTADRIRSINIALRFAYPVERKRLTTTLNTSIQIRNTYYRSKVNRIF